MKSIIKTRLTQYSATRLKEQKEAFRETLQELILYGLSQTDFFDMACFCGGTALRIFYALDRYSEDLDFSLIHPGSDFKLVNYFDAVKKSLAFYGINSEISYKDKTTHTTVQTALLKVHAKSCLEQAFGSEADTYHLPKSELIKIKFEIDVNPPDGALVESLYTNFPVSHSVVLMNAPSLFAGKLHAILCRDWGDKCKGRDLYDYLFYLKNEIPVNYELLKNALAQTLPEQADLSVEEIKQMLIEKFKNLNYTSAVDDVNGFLLRPVDLNKWNTDTFVKTIEQLSFRDVKDLRNFALAKSTKPRINLKTQ